jgi:probable HAF family extracellular repeat protein
MDDCPVNQPIWFFCGDATVAFMPPSVNDPHNENFCGWTSPDGQICRGFLWQEKTNKMIALPTLPGGLYNSKATASNNSGMILGLSEFGTECNDCTGPQVFPYEGVVWKLNASGQPYIATILPPLKNDLVSNPSGMNNAGIAVGASGGTSNNLGSSLQAVMWRNGVPVVLGNLGGTESDGFTINNNGQVIGISFLAGDAVLHGFIWQKGVMKDLGSLRPDDFGVFPQDINNRGEVVGWSCGPSEPNLFGCDGFLWRNGVMTDLNNLLTQPTTLEICCANSINDSGDIVAAAFDPNFHNGVDAQPIFLEDPPVASVPEPSTWAMMLMGLAGLGYASFRRSAKPRLEARSTGSAAGPFLLPSPG